jgi:hypothetical protein
MYEIRTKRNTTTGELRTHVASVCLLCSVALRPSRYHQFATGPCDPGMPALMSTEGRLKLGDCSRGHDKGRENHNHLVH